MSDGKQDARTSVRSAPPRRRRAIRAGNKRGVTPLRHAPLHIAGAKESMSAPLRHPPIPRAIRMRIPPWLLVGLGAIMLVGCATTEAELRTQTAAVLGQAPADIMLINIRSNSVNTFYSATTPQGRYACAAETGMAKVIALGLTSPPSCYKEATIERGTDTR